MKNLKMLLAVSMIFVSSFLVGCSDQIISPPESLNHNFTRIDSEETVKTPEAGFTFDKYFRIQIKLKPHRSFTFNEANTGFDRLNSIDVENLSIDPNIGDDVTECQDILVYGSTTDGLLGCHSKGLDLKEIIVENIGSSMMDLDVTLSGVKRKKVFPVDSQ